MHTVMMTNKRMVSEKSLKYPVLCIREPDVIVFARNDDELVVCTAKAFKSGYYDALNVIDSSGARYEVLSVKKVSNIGPFWGFNLLLGQKIRVALEMHWMTSESVQELKKELLALCSKNGNNDFILDFVKDINSSDDISDIIKLLANEYYKEY